MQISVSTSTGFPPTIVGLYWRWRAFSRAAACSGCGPESTADEGRNYLRRRGGHRELCWSGASLVAACLSACVLDVFASSPQSVICFTSGVGIRFQEIDGPVKGHGFAARGTGARIGDRLGLYAGHVPFQAREVDLQAAANAEGRNTLIQVLKRRADILQVFVLGQDSLNLQLMGQFCFQVAVGGELIVCRFWAAIDQFQRVVSFGIVPTGRFRGRRALCVLRRSRQSMEEKTQRSW